MAILAGKRDSRRLTSSFYYEFKQECPSGGNELSNFRSLATLRSFSLDNSVNFACEN